MTTLNTLSLRARLVTFWHVPVGVLLAVSAAGCGARSTQSAGPDSSSHWLTACSTNDECGDAECLCGRCTTTCDGESDCSALETAFAGFRAECAPVAGCGESAVCQIECRDDDDCPSGAPHCQEGSCVNGPRLDAGGGSNTWGDAAATMSEGPSSSTTSPGGTGNLSSRDPDTTGGTPADQCYARLAETSLTLGLANESYGAFVRSDDFVIGASTGLDGKGYRVATVALATGELHTSEPLWPETTADMLQLRVSGNTAALVTMQPEGASNRNVCRFALYDASTESATLAPQRFSDEPAGDSVENEAVWCGAEPSEQGFVLAWNQYTDNQGEQSLFAQRVSLDGSPLGERLVLARGDKLTAQVTSTSDGKRALFALGGDAAPRFVFVDEDTVVPLNVEDAVTQALSGALPEMQFVADGILMQTPSEIVLVGADGKLEAGPVAVRGLVAPFEQGYVAVERDSASGFPVTRALDSNLEQRGNASGFSSRWEVSPSTLLPLRDGTDVQVVFRERGEQRLGNLTCLDAPAPVGPQACPASSEASVAPLDLECDAPLCYFTLRLKATSLAVYGYSVVEANASPVDAEQAAAIASEAVGGFPDNEWISEAYPVNEAQAGLFTVVAPALDFGWFALVGAESGAVVTAGGIVWAGSGGYWIPERWSDASAVECGSVPVTPAATHIEPGNCETESEQPALASAEDALAVALRSNVAARAATFPEFDAFVYLYTPSVGECATGAAEYVVVFTARGSN